ncbi:MAG: M23 family metallopeptidase, partial [Magnetococcales bacterium]|nr:M23 family metallopeptidase [Magnetococcales bacterium]
MGGLLLHSWLNDPDTPSTAPFILFDTPDPAQPVTPHAPPLALPSDPLMRMPMPTLEALDELFGPADETIDPLEPDPLSLSHGTAKGLSPMEIQVNETLLTTLDPYLLDLEQKQIFANTIPTGYPVPFRGITSPFGFRMHPTMQSTRFHPGVDLQAPMNTKVITTADGVVEFAGVDTGKLGLNGLGQVISIHHNYGFTSTYSHLNKILVQAGDFVKKGA